MTVIVDTNILFSACLTPNGRIFEVLFSTSRNLQIISSDFAIAELRRHQEKLVRLSRRNASEIEKLLETILQQVDFYSDDIIASKCWQEAHRLTVGVDSNDMNFVALTLQSGGTLWTGDKKLANHLKIMGFDFVINTTELYEQLGIGG